MDSTFYLWLYRLISYVFRFYELSLIIYIFSSWVPSTRNTFIIKFLQDICEPYLKIFRKILPPMASIDFSPMLAIIFLGFLERLVYSIIFGVSFF